MIDPPVDRLPVPCLLVGDRRLFEGSGGEQAHIYAATGSKTLVVPLAAEVEIDEAVREAGKALPAWRAIDAPKRARILHALGELILRDREDLALLQTVETAVPIAFSRHFPEMAANHFFYNAGWSDKMSGEVGVGGKRGFDYTRLEPYGVVAAIVTWNAALIAASQALAPILAAGNTVVLKPSPLAPFSVLRLAQLALEAGVPPGVVNVVTGGAEAGDFLARHPGIAKIHFTGSRTAARSVLQAAAVNIVPVCMELGGKSPLLVFSDGDVMSAVQQSLSTMIGLSGQGCALPTRVLVDASVSNKYELLLRGLLRRLKIGDPLEDDTQIGPVVSAEARDRVLAIVRRARELKHGRLIAGGDQLAESLSSGYFVTPTVFADVDETSALATDEIFGPVLSVMSFEGEEQAIRMANNTSYGLCAYVYTDDVRRAHRASEALEVGTICINGVDALEPSMPFGGVKQSGYGRLGGRAGINEFTQAKNVWLSMNPARRWVR
jgi:acyl-CoA reductase-like NAD-dependent aldehyde dehydrogenase